MPVPAPHHVPLAGSVVSSCLLQADEITSTLISVEEHLGGLSGLAQVLSRLVGSVLRRYATLVDMSYESALRAYGLQAATDDGDADLLATFRAAFALVTASPDPELFSALALEADAEVVLVLAETASALLQNVEELDLSDPALVLSESLAAL